MLLVREITACRRPGLAQTLRLRSGHLLVRKIGPGPDVVMRNLEREDGPESEHFIDAFLQLSVITIAPYLHQRQATKGHRLASCQQ